MNILLISGHGANDCGAVGYGVEREETRRVTNRLAELLRPYMNVIMYPQNRNAYDDIYNGCFQVSLANIDYVFEVHFNSSDNPTARGTEIYVTPMEIGTSVEQKIVSNLTSVGFSNRGVKSEYFAVISHCKNSGVSSALVETCFISNEADMNKYNANFNSVCSAMAKGIVEGFGMSYKESVQSKPNVQNNTKSKYEYKGDDVMFNEGFYLNRYPDVAKAVKNKEFENGYHHYIQCGKKEGRQPVPPIPSNFVEGDYLELNPSVAEAVKNKQFVSGVHHYMIYGWKENRKVCKDDSSAALKEKIMKLEGKIAKAKDALK